MAITATPSVSAITRGNTRLLQEEPTESIIRVVAAVFVMLALAGPAPAQELHISASISAPSGTYVGSPSSYIDIPYHSLHGYDIEHGAPNSNFSFYRGSTVSYTPGNGFFASITGRVTLTTNSLGFSPVLTDEPNGTKSFLVYDGTANYTATAVSGASMPNPFVLYVPGSSMSADSSWSIYGEG